jgi:hypothetical protein
MRRSTATATKSTALASILRLSSDASRNITGMVDPRDGVIKTIINVGTNPIVLQNANAGSTAANRFDFGADITLAAKQSATIRYDGTDARWKLEAATSGSAVAAGAVTAQTLAASALGSFVGMVNGTIVESHVGNAVTFAVKTLAGADPSAGDPVYFVFRNVTPATGDYTVLTQTSALNMSLSAGSSAGVPGNNIPFKLWGGVINNAGSPELFVINNLLGQDIYPFGQFPIISTTTEGGAGAADSAQVAYAISTRASKPYIPLFYASYETGLATVGNWAASPTRLQLYSPGVPLPGTVVNQARSSSGAVISGSAAIPLDDTIPQSTEGDQFMTKAITPSSAAHLLRVSHRGHYATASAGIFVVAALFQDSTANALATSFTFVNSTANSVTPVDIDHILLAAATISTIFRVRAGGAVVNSFTFNGSGGGRLYGGTANSYLNIEEIAT